MGKPLQGSGGSEGGRGNAIVLSPALDASRPSWYLPPVSMSGHFPETLMAEFFRVVFPQSGETAVSCSTVGAHWTQFWNCSLLAP